MGLFTPSQALWTPKQPAPSFAHRPGVWSGVHRLIENAALTINGITQTPEFVLVGGDAAAGGWQTRQYPASPVTLALQAGTAPSYNQGSPLLGALDDSVLFNGGGFFQAPNNTLGDLTTQDMVVEGLIKVPAAVAVPEMYVSHLMPDPVYAGWYVQLTATPTLALTIYVADTPRSVVSATLTPGSWVHFFVVINRDEATVAGSKAHINGAASGPGVDFSAVAASATAAASLKAGAWKAGGQLATGSLAYFATYMAANWHQAGVAGPAEWAEVAKQRFALLTGSRPLISWAGDAYPAAAGSTSAAYQEKRISGEPRLFLMGASAPRFCEKVDADGRTLIGACVEPGATNSCLQSQTLGTTWTGSNASIAASDSAVAPDGTTTADTLTASADNGFLKQAFGTITAVARVFSIYVQRNGASDVAGKVQLVKTSDASVIATVNFTAGASWSRTSVTGTCVLNDTEVRVVINSNGGSVYAWGAQVETGSWPTSYIPTTTAAVARVAGVLRYAATNILTSGVQGALRFRFLAPATLPTVSHYLAGCSVAGGAADNLHVYIEAASGHLVVDSAKTGGNAGATSVDTNFCDNKIHEALVTWRTNDLRVCVDGTWGTPDTSCDIAAFDRIEVGMDHAAANQAGPVLVGDIKAFPRFVSSWSQRGSGFTALT